MDGMINFLEIVGNDYILNRKNLRLALKNANGCNSIAVISIIGPESSGKTFFIKCILNYMNSRKKDQWPACDDAIIKSDQTQCKQIKNKNKVLKISSKPFIIEEQIKDEIQKTSVYLIDSDNIFDQKMNSKIARDISTLLLLTSSTMIYNHIGILPVFKKFLIIYFA
jgi:ABC-type phosphate/phosphonate transport system ATPase subunit